MAKTEGGEGHYKGKVGEGINFEAEGRSVKSRSGDDWEMASNQDLKYETRVKGVDMIEFLFF